MRVSTWWLLWILAAVTGGSECCPLVCICNITIDWGNDTLTLTDCSGQGLLESPEDIPTNTEYLDLSGNLFEELREETVANLTNLLVLDTTGNPSLWNIPTAPTLLRVETILTDKGSTCCIYELNWKSAEGRDSEAFKLARESCVAEQPYQECRDDLVNVFSLVLYTVTLVLSLVLNPWVIVVDLVIPRRRRDPYILVLVHFSITNIFLTFYAGMFTGYGFTYLNRYQYYMDDWMENPACTIMGFVLVSSSLQLSFLSMMMVVDFYLNMRHSLERRRQFTAKRLHLATAVTWLVAIFIATIPFMMGNNGYNNVAQCLPFYADNSKYPFTFLTLYTFVETASLVVIVTLTGIIVNSFVRQNRRIRNKDHADIMDERIVQENRSVRKAILSKVMGFIVFSMVLDTLLILSCLENNELAILGREWFARLCVLQAVFWPLIGSFRHKEFYRDTRRMFQLWNCYDWEKNKIVLRPRAASQRQRDSVSS